jgi:hypothetical protein
MVIPVWVHEQENSTTSFIPIKGVDVQFRADVQFRRGEWIPTVESWDRDGNLLYYRMCLPSRSSEDAIVYAMMFIKDILMNHHGWLVEGLTRFV